MAKFLVRISVAIVVLFAVRLLLVLYGQNIKPPKGLSVPPDTTSLSWYPCHCRIAPIRLPDCLTPMPFVVDGLHVQHRFLGEAATAALLADLTKYPFLPYPGKTCQEFGWNTSFYIEHPTLPYLPPSLQRVGGQLFELGLLPRIPNYVLVNRYEPGQGIHPHVDDPWYDDGIAVLSIGESALMGFAANASFCGMTAFYDGTLMAMQREARYRWTHTMFPDDGRYGESVLKRSRTRVAVTFRHVNATTAAAYSRLKSKY